jgi:hypothetical protein
VTTTSGGIYVVPPPLDARDQAIVDRRAAQRPQDPEPRPGDFVVHADGVALRIGHVYGARDWAAEWAVQTSTGDSRWYLAEGGHVRHGGGLNLLVPGSTLTLTEETRPGLVWIFHHDLRRAHNAVSAEITFRVYACTLPAPR